jgi:hypothetical protein
MLSVQMKKYFLSSDVTISSQFRRKNIFSVQRHKNIFSIQIANMLSDQMQKYLLISDVTISSQFRRNNVLPVPIGPYLLSSDVTKSILSSDARMKIAVASAIKTLLCLMRKYREGKY